MIRDCVGHVLHNSISSKNCRVVILVNKKLNFVALNQLQDSYGWILDIEALVNGVRAIFCNLYAPNINIIYRRNWGQ